MAVTRLEITARGPYEGGASYGEAGAYERIDGLMHFAVDPADPANAAIVDLDRAARDADGLVHFWADFVLLQPVEAGRANRRLLFHVANRGRLGSVPFCNAAPEATLSERIDPGDGFLLRRGWTVLWAGWQWDVTRQPGLVGLEAPEAVGEDGRPLGGPILVQFQPNEVHADQELAHQPLHPPPGRVELRHRPYPAADPEEPTAVLTVREWSDGPRQTIARERWRFARDEGGHPIADDSRVWLEGGFQPGLIYEVIYRTRACPVVGAGLLAVRDAVSFARYDDGPGNPCAGRIDHAYGFGVSQCGRFLRDYLYHGMNLDEAGRPAFDGLMPHVAGARRGEFNFRSAQPSAQHVRNQAHAFPFADDEQVDPVSGRRDGLLRRQRALGGLPRIMTTNTSSEYWRIDASLLHTDPEGTVDVEPPDEVRIYLYAGTQHGPGWLPTKRDTPSGARTANLQNLVNFNPLLRATLVNLDEWVSRDQPPPPSAFPRLDDGTARPREQVLRYFAELPDAALPDPALLPSVRRIEAGPEAATGGAPLPLPVGEPFPSTVPAVDESGNEVAGIRLPDLTVPVASYTGWNPRDPETGGAGQIVDMQGSTLPLPRTEEERQRQGDPRPAIAASYRDRDDYLTRVRAAAEELVDRRYLLAEDVDLVVANAAERYDALLAGVEVAAAR